MPLTFAEHNRILLDEVASQRERIAELESICAEKQANIAFLIEELQKAEAQNAQSVQGRNAE